MRLIAWLIAAALVRGAAAQDTADPVADTPEEEAWSFSVTASTYAVPDDRDYVQPTFTADRGPLHLEFRYNYEDFDTASAWIGWNMSTGEELTLEFAPMLGGVVGDTSAIALGYRASLSWWRLELYTEGEYVITHEHSERFFYTWSELSLSPLDWCRVGLVVQRTKAYETERDVQRGFLVGFNVENVSFTTYVLNPDQDATFIFALGLEF